MGTLKDELTPTQLKFLKHYLSPDSKTFGNAVKSGIKAGYSEEYSKQLPGRLPAVVRQKMSVMLSVDDIVEKLQQLIDLFEDTDRRKELGFSSSDVLKGMEMAGKYLKMFTEKHELKVETVKPLLGGTSGSNDSDKAITEAQEEN
jgi:hypothetical protein